MNTLIPAKGPPQCGCGRCHALIDATGYCWCPDNRDPVAQLAAAFPLPYGDPSGPEMWREEMDILRVLHEGKVKLVQDRGYFQETKTYGVSWYWEIHPDYPRQWDGPITRLLGRQMIRPVRCAGGYTWMELTKAAAEAIQALGPHKGDIAEKP